MNTSDHRHLPINFMHHLIRSYHNEAYDQDQDDEEDQESFVLSLHDDRYFVFDGAKLLHGMQLVKELVWTIAFQGVDKSFAGGYCPVGQRIAKAKAEVKAKAS